MKTVAEFIIEEQAGVKDYKEALAQVTDPQVRAVLTGILAQECEHVLALQALPENINYKPADERRDIGNARYGNGGTNAR